jgi:hypothetical protein
VDAQAVAPPQQATAARKQHAPCLAVPPAEGRPKTTFSEGCLATPPFESLSAPSGGVRCSDTLSTGSHARRRLDRPSSDMPDGKVSVDPPSASPEPVPARMPEPFSGAPCSSPGFSGHPTASRVMPCQCRAGAPGVLSLPRPKPVQGPLIREDGSPLPPRGNLELCIG